MMQRPASSHRFRSSLQFVAASLCWLGLIGLAQAQYDKPKGRILEKKEADALGKDALIGQKTWYQMNVAPAIDGVPVQIAKKEVSFRKKDGSVFVAPIDSFYESDRKRFLEWNPDVEKSAGENGKKREAAKYPEIAPYREWIVPVGQNQIAFHARLLGYADHDLFFEDEEHGFLAMLSDELVSEEDREFAQDCMDDYEARHGALDTKELLSKCRIRYFLIPHMAEILPYEILGYVGPSVLVRQYAGTPLGVERGIFEPGRVHRHLTILRKRNPENYNQEEYRFPVEIPKELMVETLPPPDEDTKKVLAEWVNPPRKFWKKSDIPVEPGDNVLDINLAGDTLLIENKRKFFAMHVSGKPRTRIPDAAMKNGATYRTVLNPITVLANDKQSVWVVENETAVQWNLATGKSIKKLGHWKAVRMAQYSGDCEHIAVLDSEGLVHFLDLAGNRERILPTIMTQKRQTGVGTFLVADDGNSVALSLGQEVYHYHFPDEQHPPKVSNFTIPRGATPSLLTPDYMLTVVPTAPGLLVTNFQKEASQTLPFKVAFQSVSIGESSIGPIVQMLHGMNYEKSENGSHCMVVTRDIFGKGFLPLSWVESVQGDPNVYTPGGEYYVFVSPGKAVLAKRPEITFLANDSLIKIIRSHLKKDDCAGLEGIADYLRSDEVSKDLYVPDGAYNEFARLIVAAMARYFEPEGGDLAERIDLRLQYFQRRHPTSTFWKVLLANHRINRAWHARGNQYGFTITDDGQEEFQRQIESALDILRRDVSFKDLASIGFTDLLTIGRAQGWSKERYSKVAAKLFEGRARNAVPAHLSFLESKASKWGGSLEDCLEYIEEAEPHVDPSRRDIFYAMAMTKVIENERDMRIAKNIDWDKFSKGVEQYYELMNDAHLLDRAFEISMGSRQFELARKILKIRCTKFVGMGDYVGIRMRVAIETAEARAKEEDDKLK